MLINELIYFFDMAFDDLKEIREIEIEMKDINTWNSLTEEQQTERKETLDAKRREAKSAMIFANAVIELCEFLTQNIPQPFFDDIILPRFSYFFFFVFVCLFLVFFCLFFLLAFYLFLFFFFGFFWV